MTTRDLGFIAARALAVWLVFTAMAEAGNIATFFMTLQSLPQDRGFGIAMVCVFGLHLLLAWQLWLHADKFGGSAASWQTGSEGSRPFVHLMLTGIGTWMIANSLLGVAVWLSGSLEELARHYSLEFFQGGYLLIPLIAGICLVLYPVASRKGGLLQMFGWPSKEELADD